MHMLVVKIAFNDVLCPTWFLFCAPLMKQGQILVLIEQSLVQEEDENNGVGL